MLLFIQKEAFLKKKYCVVIALLFFNKKQHSIQKKKVAWRGALISSHDLFMFSLQNMKAVFSLFIGRRCLKQIDCDNIPYYSTTCGAVVPGYASAVNLPRKCTAVRAPIQQ